MLLSATVAMDDLQDVRQSIKGDSEAYRRLIERYQQHVSQIMFRFARNKGAHQELVQDVFVEAYFGIFLSHEVIMLLDVPVHKTAKELGVTRTSIYTKYTGLSPP